MPFNKSFDLVLLLLRLCFGGLMAINHGWSKFQKLLAGGPYEWADPLGMGPALSLGLASFAEFICAILLVLGLFTRLAALPLIVTMFVAAFIVHWSDGFKEMEHAILFLIPYVCIAIAGPGWYSFDAQFRKGF